MKTISAGVSYEMCRKARFLIFSFLHTILQGNWYSLKWFSGHNALMNKNIEKIDGGALEEKFKLEEMKNDLVGADGNSSFDDYDEE